jgi:heterodisulfide reductase subunit B2
MRYGFYPGCSYHTAAGYKESIDTLNKILGIEFIELEDWSCCGATTTFSQDHENAVALVGRLIAIANQQGFDEIITVCNACYTTLRKGSELLKKSTSLINDINNRLSDEQLKIEKVVPVKHYLEILKRDIPKDVWKEKTVRDCSNLNIASYYGCQFTRPWEDVDCSERPTMMDQILAEGSFKTVAHSVKTFCCGAAHMVPHTDDCKNLIIKIINECHFKGGQIVSVMCPLCQLNLESGQLNQKSPIPVLYFTQLLGYALGATTKELGLSRLLLPANLSFEN